MRSTMPEVEATPLRSKIAFQYPAITEACEAEHDGEWARQSGTLRLPVEQESGEVERMRSTMPEVEATPLRSKIAFQYPAITEAYEDAGRDGGTEPEIGDVERLRSTLREVAATPLRSNTRFQYPAIAEAYEEAGQEGEALEISVMPLMQPRGYTPLSKAVSRHYPINSRKQIQHDTSTNSALEDSERDANVRLPLQERSSSVRCLSSPLGKEIDLSKAMGEQEKENWGDLKKRCSDGPRGLANDREKREMPASDIGTGQATDDTPLKLYELSLPAAIKALPTRRSMVRSMSVVSFFSMPRRFCAKWQWSVSVTTQLVAYREMTLVKRQLQLILASIQGPRR